MAVVGQTRPFGTAPRASNLRTPLFIFGVALALVAFLVMFAFGVVFVGRTQPTGSVPVVVANQTIDARTPISPDMLTLSSLPPSAVPPSTYLHIADVKGYAAVAIYKGQPISSNLVSSTQTVIGPPQFLQIPKGYVAFTLPTSELQGAGGYVVQGDYVDVIATVNTAVFSLNRPRSVSRTVFTNVYVLRVGPQSALQAQGQSQGVTSSLTVLMSQCDANYMQWLLVNATVKYSLVSHDDYPPTNAPQVQTCPAEDVGPGAVDARWQFTNG